MIKDVVLKSLFQENDPVCRESDPLLREWAESLFKENNLVGIDGGPLLRKLSGRQI
jgi:hypothetical protein